MKNLARHSDTSQGGATRCPPLLALARWREEVRAGHRSPTLQDGLWRAAAREWLAQEHFAMGYPTIAETFLADARDALREDLQARRKGAA